MSLISPDKIFASLVGAMGISPAQIQNFVNELVAEVRTMKAEREAFKPAASRAYADVIARLDMQERKIDSILLFLHALPVAPPGAPLAQTRELNGDRHDAIGHEHTDFAHDANGGGSGGE